MAGTPRKVTISTLTALLFISLAVFFDGIKLVLLLIDTIPLVGAPIGFVGSWIDSALEFICITCGLYLAGAYRGKTAITNTMFTMGMAMVDFVPILNDFPFTTAAVIAIIIKSRMNDKVEEVEHKHKTAAAAKKHAEQEVKVQRATVAMQNADAKRQQAMAISKAAANDNSENTVAKAA